MVNTLVTELESVDKVTSNAGIDKIVAYRNILEKWAEQKKNSLVRMALNGEINISHECNEIVEKLYGPREKMFTHRKNYYPRFVKAEDQIIYTNEKGQEIKINELEAVVGDFVDSNFHNLFENPVGCGVTASLLGMGGINLVPEVVSRLYPTLEKAKFNRRKFTKFCGLVAAGFGGLFGEYKSTEDSLTQDTRVNNAAYVQSIISKVREVYKL